MTKYKDIEHGSTVVVCTNLPELFYVIKWCEAKGKTVVPCIIEPVVLIYILNHAPKICDFFIGSSRPP